MAFQESCAQERERERERERSERIVRGD